MSYRLLYPLRTYLIVSGRADGVFNVMAADWVTALSASPFLVGVAISPKRYTHRLITETGEFVVSVPSVEMVSDVWTVGTLSGPEKLRRVKFTLAPAKRVGTPIIREALANLECALADYRDYGDHTLFVGEVVEYSYREEAFRGGEPIPGAGFLAHLARNKFAKFSGEAIQV